MVNKTKTAPTRDTIDLLNKEAFHIRVTDTNKALEQSREAYQLAATIHYTKGKAEGLTTQGFCNIRLSNNLEGKRLLEEALALYKETNDLAGEGYVHEGLGIAYRNLGDYKASLEFLHKGLEIIKHTNNREIESLCYYHIGVTYKYMGNLDQALEGLLTSLTIAKETNNWASESYSLNNLGSVYEELGDFQNALDFYHQSLVIRKKSGDKWGEAGCLDNIGKIFLKQQEYQQAGEYCRNSLEISRSVSDKKGEANALFHLAETAYALNNFEAAFEKAQQSLHIREEIGDKKGQAEIYLSMAAWVSPGPQENDKMEQQLLYLENALQLAEEVKAQDILLKIHHSFFKIFKQQNKFQEALAHLESSTALERAIHSLSVNQKLLNLEITHKVEQSKKEAEIYRLRNVELAKLYEESNKRKEELQTALTELKATQEQLLQREKMASLGQLTAGIAHEIKNPLNFVNNFSDLNVELIDEVFEIIAKLEKNETIGEISGILQDVRSNLLKIHQHGNRADGIVKSMLQHRRGGSGKMEPTDLNALVKEYVNLSFHGMRAGKNPINVAIDLDLHEQVGMVPLIGEDFSRVIVNICNNAFDAMREKFRNNHSRQDYMPKLTVRTFRKVGGVYVEVEDNGPGIPDALKDKIMQPFFTTKRGTEGTGLGLSITYDIIKNHKGTLKISTQEKLFTRFSIYLPNNH